MKRKMNSKLKTINPSLQTKKGYPADETITINGN